MTKHFEGNTLVTTLVQSQQLEAVAQEIVVVDLFAGAGGVSTGCIEAAKELKLKLKLVAVNHWDIAISTHKANYPWAQHFQADVDKLDPRKVVPDGHVHLLIAAPECTHHSRAAGGMPKNDQKRASPRYIVRWLRELDVDVALIENVEELRTWGPLDTKTKLPIKERKGEFYAEWKASIIALGYVWEEHVLNAADYGAATSRRRLFIVATKAGRTPVWPTPTHAKNPPVDSGLKKWTAARTIIDWTIEGESIFTRKKPLSPRTIERIKEGLRKFGSQELQPFIIAMEHGGSTDSIEKPLRTITTAKGGALAVADPSFVVSYHGGKGRKESRIQSTDAPLGALDTSNRYGVATPFLVAMEQVNRQGPKAKSVDDPAWTISAKGAIGLAEASIQSFIVPNFGERGDQAPRVHSVNDPCPCVTSKGAGNLIEASIEDATGEDDAFLLPNEGYFRQNVARSLSEPVGTITQRGAGRLVQPFLLEYYGNGKPQNVENPLATVTTKDRFALVNSCIVRINGTQPSQIKNSATSVAEPVPVIATRPHLALVQPEINGKRLEIKFRMLQPKELAAATGFPHGYRFLGTKTEIVRQIGNAIVVPMAKALCLALLRETTGED